MHKAGAQANGFGFPKIQAGPKAVSGQRSGPAWPGFFWLGLARLLASGRSRHITKEQGDEEEEEEGSDNEEPEIVPVVPQKRKTGKDTNKSASRSFHVIYSPHIFSKSSSERVNRHEPDEVAVMRKITYNLAIFSVAELAKPQARREPAARFLVLPSDLEWLDIHAHLKIKAGDVLFPGQAAINDDAYEITFCIARHIPNPLPLSCVGDYKHLVKNALHQQQPTVKIMIKAIARPQVRLQVCIYPPSN